MLVGFVSDHRFVALPEALLEFEQPSGRRIEARSTASGAVDVDLPPGTYRVTLQKAGYGPKRVSLSITDRHAPYQFRLLPNDILLGYAWPKWARSGEKSEFRVHSSEAYVIELWRYGGTKVLVRPIGVIDEHGPNVNLQITPDGDYSQTGVQWNKWGYGNSQQQQIVKAPDRSSLYYFHVRTESGRFFSFPWIVAPATPQSRIAVLASNMQWNAYNNFGGRSNYVQPDRLPATPTVNARLELKRYTDRDASVWSCDEYLPLSFDRPELSNYIPPDEQPTSPIEGRLACHTAPAEWRLLAWLEREGFPYDYYAETQFHEGVLDLKQYRVLMISTHPEYWSRKMYRTLKDWVFKGGGKLMYLGGNGLNCEVEMLDDFSCVFRNGSIGARDENMAQAGKESRFDLYNESEANLLGVRFSDTGIMTGAPYRVIDGSNWAFANTGLRNGDLFGEKYLNMRCPGGASGYETDKISKSSPAGCQLLAKGLNPDDGGAEMVYHRTDSGGEVFSAGSISYASSLPVDEHLSTITKNVLQRFLG